MTGYALASNDLVLGHDQTASLLFNDLSGKVSPTDIEAIVASGDLFVELATELDEITLNLIESPGIDVSLKLDKLTEILLYMQQHYRVITK